MTRVNNTVLHSGKLMRVNLKCSHHRKERVIMCPDTGVSYPCGGNHFALYKCIKSAHCTP